MKCLYLSWSTSAVGAAGSTSRSSLAAGSTLFLLLGVSESSSLLFLLLGVSFFTSSSSSSSSCLECLNPPHSSSSCLVCLSLLPLHPPLPHFHFHLGSSSCLVSPKPS